MEVEVEVAEAHLEADTPPSPFPPPLPLECLCKCAARSQKTLLPVPRFDRLALFQMPWQVTSSAHLQELLVSQGRTWTQWGWLCMASM